MQTLTEKRVYGDRGGAHSCFVASETGLVHALVTGLTIGEFSLVDRLPARDVSVGPAFGVTGTDDRVATVAVATETDVLVGTVSNTNATDTPAALSDALKPTDFGPAVAVDVGSESVVAATPDGSVRRLDAIESTWRTIDGPAELAIAGIDVPLVATDRGVYRIVDGSLRTAGLTDVRDVDASGTPLAATASGLYELGNGWQLLAEGAISAVSVRAVTEGDPISRIHVVSGSTLSAVEPSDAGGDTDPGSLHPVASAADPLADLDHGTRECVYAISSTGTVLAAGPDEVRRRELGVRGASALSFDPQ